LKDATILVVDDETALLGIFRAWLQREGCRVLVAENGAQGLQLAAGEDVDVIVSDVRMPGMDGIELVRRLNALGAYKPKVIFVSGFSDVPEREYYDLGIGAALRKPLRRQEMVDAVANILTPRRFAWQRQPDAVPETTLRMAVNSVADALESGLLALGQGGFCVRTTLPARAGQRIGLDLRFEHDGQAIAGTGIVQWVAAPEEQMGIEILYVEDEHRDWIASLVAERAPHSFIPRSSIGEDPGLLR